MTKISLTKKSSKKFVEQSAEMLASQNSGSTVTIIVELADGERMRSRVAC
jgi:hypothetical protein